jgi:hypothetical protein
LCTNVRDFHGSAASDNALCRPDDSFARFRDIVPSARCRCTQQPLSLTRRRYQAVEKAIQLDADPIQLTSSFQAALPTPNDPGIVFFTGPNCPLMKIVIDLFLIDCEGTNDIGNFLGFGIAMFTFCEISTRNVIVMYMLSIEVIWCKLDHYFG